MMQGDKPKVNLTNTNTWIAGGAIRSWFVKEHLSDIDVFSSNESHMERFKTDNGITKEHLAFTSQNADTYKVNNFMIQLIKIYKPDIPSLFDSFDYTCCQFAWDGTKIYSTTEAIVSTLRKHLSIHKIQKGYEVDSLRRAFKYYEKGYKPCMGTIRDLAKSFSEVKEEVIQKQAEISPNGGYRIVRWD